MKKTHPVCGNHRLQFPMPHLLRKITVIFHVLADKGTVTHKIHKVTQTVSI